MLNWRILTAPPTPVIVVLVHNGRLRRYYAITRKGEERIDEFLQDMQEFARICEIIRSEDPHD